MTRLDAAMQLEADARRALDRRLGEFAQLVADCQYAVLMGITVPVNSLPAKAAGVHDLATIWEAARGGVENVRAARRAA